MKKSCCLKIFSVQIRLSHNNFVVLLRKIKSCLPFARLGIARLYFFQGFISNLF